MSFDPFLKQIARHYATLDTDASARLCFVFPNQRSGYFFEEYIKEEYRRLGNRTVLMPRVSTMSGLVEQWCDLVEATPTELSMLLYRTYIDLTAHSQTDDTAPALAPDRFMFWSDVIINDFNEVDRAMANAQHLFRNLSDIKELQTNPLTAEQIELVKQFWGTTGVPWLEEDNGHLWLDNPTESHDAGVRNFLKLWSILGPLYEAFGDTLRQNGLCYIGMAYREVAQNLEHILEAEESSDIYVFCGFSELSKAEIKIFDELKKSGRAIFHWDDTLPNLGTAEDFPLKLIRGYQRRFPSPTDFELQYPDYSPLIRVYAVPSETGQVKVAARLLRAGNGLNRANAVEWAVVMPETSLSMPLLNSLDLPQGVEMNITMGYPLQSTAMSAVMEQLAVVRQLTRAGETSTLFNKPALLELLSQPLLLTSAPTDCRNLIAELEKTKGLYVKWDRLKPHAGCLEFLFMFNPHADVNGTLNDMCLTASRLLELYDRSRGNLHVDEDHTDESTDLQREFLQAYIFQLEQLQHLITKYSLEPYIEHVDETVSGAIEKMMRQMQVNFAGTPLKGVQLMGVLETRALDFDRLIITSMNERTFPRKLRKATFLPQNLRIAYGMESHEEQEIAMAYHFYRLASRARYIDLIYNSDTEGVTSGEMSRYLYQLKYLYRYPGLKEFTLNYLPWTITTNSIEIVKTPRVMEQLEQYRAPNGSRNLSASSIKKLLDCELKFYLETVCRFNDDNQSPDHVDDSIYGKIVHFIMEHVYNGSITSSTNERPRTVVTYDRIETIFKSNVIEKIATAAVNIMFMDKTGSEVESSLEGETELFRQMAITDVRNLLRAEQALMGHNGTITIEQTETNKHMVMDFGNGLNVNFTYIIDRVDTLQLEGEAPRLRIVDYKTGSDAIKFNEVTQLVDYSSCKYYNDVPHAITQLMLYSTAFARDNGLGEEPIQPIIYKFRDLSKPHAKIQPLKHGPIKQKKTPLTDYREIEDEFMALMNKKIQDLFNPDIPLRQAPTDVLCKYCDFKEICGRTRKE